jgi:hypothetical protein
MRYMFLIYGNEAAYEKMSKADLEADMGNWVKYGEGMKKAGVWEAGAALKPTGTATTVRNKSGKTVPTDGPFAETKEQLGGYYVVNVPNLEEALKWAGQCPGAAYGAIEVRPILEF